jgi:UDP-N-acetyl-D-mannosaminuronate dehydrogenase
MMSKIVLSKTKDVVAGLGEIGSPILKLISVKTNAVGYDVNPKLIDQKQIKKFESFKTRLLHICIPFNANFEKNVIALNQRYDPQGIVIHSTISPGTTKNLQKKISIPVIYSATRGVHKRMLYDLRRYTKFFAIEPDAPNVKWATTTYANLMKKCGVKTKKMSNPMTLELAKIVVDTSYYGWLINYAQLSNMIAIKHNVNYDEMWSFADEIQKFLRNRPKMFPGFIGGHCVIPNLNLINDETLDLIREINNDYAKILKKRQSQGKKY